VTARPAARVLLLDQSDRLLLVRFVSPDTGVPFWAPVGGGLEPGETYEQAAVREVAEETGLAGLELGPHVYDREVAFTWRAQRWESIEQWFVARVDAFEPSREGWTPQEHQDITVMRWWTAAELAAADEALVPLDLAARLVRLLADGPPSTPQQLGF
jgi:8-oxo-dGTP pyrophosphatase MutT (NUDIX family)